MLTAILLAFGGALTAPLVHRFARGWAGWVLALVPLGLFAYFVSRVPAVAGGGSVRQVHEWVPGLGVHASFLLDGLGLLFALLVTGFGALIVAYGGGYLKGHEHLGRFYLFILLFMSSMLGLVLADNLITLFVFWELTSIASYLLIGFDHRKEEARASALQALLVTGGGGLALLAGFVLLGMAGGTWELSEIVAQGDAIRTHGWYGAILALVLIGAFTKSAQVPFHFWLPNAMAAPTPVSAYLHSATMVKAGIYLLARTMPVLGGTAAWVWTLSLAGAATMLLGAFLAVRQTDLKRILAYTTLSALGTLTLLLGLGFQAGVLAAMVFLVVHSLYKGALFLVAGNVDHEAGTRNVLALGGLRRAMPITAAAAVIAGLSMAGLPPLFGFIGKELVYKAALDQEGVLVAIAVVALAANALTMIAAGLLVVRPFFGAAAETPKHAHEAPAAMWLGPVLLAGVGALLGVFPGLVAGALIAPAVGAVLATPAEVNLMLWHGFNLALLMSVLTAVLGVLGYRAWARLHDAYAPLGARLTAWGPQAGYERALEGMLRFAAWQTRILQPGRMRFYIGATFFAALVLVGGTLLLGGGAAGALVWPEARWYEWSLAALVVASAGVAVVTRSRMTALAALGVGGFGIALFFVLLGAPDLAMTQFLVETLIVIILLLVVQQLPRPQWRVAPVRRDRLARDIALAGGVGVMMTVLLLAVTRLPFDPFVSEQFARDAVPGGFGRNIVNVILVDFRAVDTLGEIVVIAVAALGVIALLRMRRGSVPQRKEAA